jgi:hypothetical protein
MEDRKFRFASGPLLKYSMMRDSYRNPNEHPSGLRINYYAPDALQAASILRAFSSKEKMILNRNRVRI